jgi:ProP effector
LAYYTANDYYLDRILAGADRIGLDGQPCGKVTAEEAAHARARFKALNAKRKARHVARRATTESAAPPPTSTPRSSLAGLRAAYKQRVATQQAVAK